MKFIRNTTTSTSVYVDGFSDILVNIIKFFYLVLLAERDDITFRLQGMTEAEISLYKCEGYFIVALLTLVTMVFGYSGFLWYIA